MKTIKTFNILKLLFGVIIVLCLIVQLTDLFPSVDKEFARSIGIASSAAVLIFVAITNLKYKKLYEATLLRNIQIKDNSEHLLNLSFDNNKALTNAREELQRIAKDNKDLKEHIYEQDKLLDNLSGASPIAITEDNRVFYSFDVKKESGINVSSKVNGKTEKLPAQLAFIKGENISLVTSDAIVKKELSGGVIR